MGRGVGCLERPSLARAICYGERSGGRRGEHDVGRGRAPGDVHKITGISSRCTNLGNVRHDRRYFFGSQANHALPLANLDHIDGIGLWNGYEFTLAWAETQLGRWVRS